MHIWRLLLFGVFAVLQTSECFSDRGLVNAQRECSNRRLGTKLNENSRYKSDSEALGSPLNREYIIHSRGQSLSRAVDNDRRVDSRSENRRIVSLRPESNRVPDFPRESIRNQDRHIKVSVDVQTNTERVKSIDKVRGYPIKEQSLIRNTCDKRRVTDERRTDARMTLRDAREERSREASANNLRESRNIEERNSNSIFKDNDMRRLTSERRSALHDIRDARSRSVGDERKERRVIGEDRDEKRITHERCSTDQMRKSNVNARLIRDIRKARSRNTGDERRTEVRIILRDARAERSREVNTNNARESREKRNLNSISEGNNIRRLTSERRFASPDTRDARSRSAGDDRNDKRVTSERRTEIRMTVRDAREERSREVINVRKSCDIKERNSHILSDENNMRRLINERRSALHDTREARSQSAGDEQAERRITSDSREERSRSAGDERNVRRVAGERRIEKRTTVRDAREARSLNIGANNMRRLTSERRSALYDTREVRSQSAGDEQTERSISSERRTELRMTVRDSGEERSRSAGDERNVRRVADERRIEKRTTVRDAREARSLNIGANNMRRLTSERPFVLYDTQEVRSQSAGDEQTERRIIRERRTEVRMAVRDNREERSREVSATREARSRSVGNERSVKRVAGERRTEVRRTVRDAQEARSRNVGDNIRESRNIVERIERIARTRSEDNYEGITDERHLTKHETMIAGNVRSRLVHDTKDMRSRKVTKTRESHNIEDYERRMTGDRISLNQIRYTTINGRARDSREVMPQHLNSRESRNNEIRKLRVIDARVPMDNNMSLNTRKIDENKRLMQNSQRIIRSVTDVTTDDQIRRIRDVRSQTEQNTLLYKTSSFLPAMFYALQAIYLCSILLHSIGKTSDKKGSRASLWDFTSKLIKVD